MKLFQRTASTRLKPGVNKNKSHLELDSPKKNLNPTRLTLPLPAT